MNENLELAQQAGEILEWSRRKLASKLPEFFPAIYLLVPKEIAEPAHLWTDGEMLYYHPETVVKDYLAKKDEIAVQILHIVIHGLMGHFTKRRGHNEALFDAAADLKANSFMDRLDIPFSKRWKVAEVKKMKTFDRSSLEVICQLPENEQEASELFRTAAPFHIDDHSGWTRNAAAGGSKSNETAAALEKLWSDTALQVARRMGESKKGHYGSLGGELCEEFRDPPESTVSYQEMLRRFLVKRERPEVDPDAIDPIWYHVGLELTGDAPLVEPVEVREDSRTMEFLVALDTSGSCGGAVMRGFLSELLAILRDAGDSKIQFTLIQCDAEIQSVQTMTREDTVEQIMRGIKISGFGGTDFRPVFDYIEREREAENGKRFRGLLYLSDGCGSFPKKKPDYPVVFLFPKAEQCEYWDYPLKIPEWVTQAYITEDQRLRLHEKDN